MLIIDKFSARNRYARRRLFYKIKIVKCLKMEVVALEQEGRRERLFDELVALQRDMEKKLAAKEQFIKRFQTLAQTEEEPLSLLNLFACPVAMFKPGGYLHRVNHALMENTDLRESDLSDRNISFLDRITSENFAMLEAAEGVFYGKTALLSRLSNPLALFCKNWSYPTRDIYHSALFFPLTDDEGHISCGVVMLLK